MTEKPILFSGPMVRAILEGKKTQTRRTVKGWPNAGTSEWQLLGFSDGVAAFRSAGERIEIKAPYSVGTRLWVRETWGVGTRPDPGDGWVDGIEYRADVEYIADPSRDFLRLHRVETPPGVYLGDIRPGWRPSIHMPRWASRISLLVTDVRCQRLQDITEEDARAEGAEPWPFDPEQPMTSGELGAACPYRGGFAVLWDDINTDRGFTWYSNPWVWAYTFEVMPNE